MSDVTATLPYPGLRAFTRDESMLFFGREDCVDAMIERLAATRFLAVLGASGSGKSSLVRTGLFDGLGLGFFARAGARWRIVETHPGGAPMRNLAEALARAGGEGEQAADIETLLAQGRLSLIDWAGGGRLAPGENLLLLIDQFEELFRYADYAAREEAEEFVALLIESARNRDLPIHVVVTMRSEYLGACALIPGLAEQINAGFYLTPRMSRKECRMAIEGPAAVLDFTIEPALTNRILNDMAGFAPWEVERGVVQTQILSRRADQLPLMQHLLNRLWLRARDKGGPIVLTTADYEAVGGLVGALDAHGGETLAALDEADRPFAATVFRALISGPDPTNAVRRPSRFAAIVAELAANGAPSGAAGRIVDRFRAEGCNFLQPAEPAPFTATTLIDISHESLIRQWTILSDWMTEEAQAGANWRLLVAAADRFAASQGDLLTGQTLAQLQRWWDTDHPTEAWAERHGGRHAEAAAFLEASVAARDAAQNAEIKRQRGERTRSVIIATLIVMLLPSLVLLGYSWNYARAKTAEAAKEHDFAGTLVKEAVDYGRKKSKENAAVANALQDNTNKLRQSNIDLEKEKQKVIEAERKSTMALSIVGFHGSLEKTIEYCGGHGNETACAILRGGGAPLK